jgi:hypothetical protein
MKLLDEKIEEVNGSKPTKLSSVKVENQHKPKMLNAVVRAKTV